MSAYSTGRMRPEQRPAMLALLQASLDGLRDPDVIEGWYRWSHVDAPEGPPDTVVATHGERGEVIGCGSAYPRRVQVGEIEMLAGIPADFAVGRAHRLGGAALQIQRALIGGPAPYAFFFGFPNKSALPVLRRVGYRSLVTMAGWVKPLSVGHTVRRYVRAGGLSRALTAPLDFLLAARDALRPGRWRRARGEFVARADVRFDRLWARARRHYPVAGARTSAYLNWRYVDCVTHRYRLFCLRDRDGAELAGYVVCEMKDGKAFVADLFALDMQATARNLLLRFADALRAEKCGSVFVAYGGNPAFEECLRASGFFPRGSLDRDVVLLPARGAAGQERLLADSRNWYLFDGEVDV